MAAKRKRIPRYSKVQINGHEYYKTDIEDADGKRVILYGKTREEVYDKEMAALEQIDKRPAARRNFGTAMGLRISGCSYAVHLCTESMALRK